MSTQLLPKPADTGSSSNAPLHCVCATCYPTPAPGNIALCGHRCRNAKTFEPPPQDLVCMVCFDLIPQGCPNCGSAL